ncbi:hypothetical protein [Natrinema sp. DC36]|uniref:hypothetical protein n=1 Tax=Natrinema sp. DC36 TaxID=2878680 RepID=UPI001CF086E9|nr:hypothetical protein [Natrinema sp. DC36]
MCATFSDDDVGKPIENDADETVGVVTAVEGDVAYVRPDPAVVGSIKSSLGWEKGAETTVTLDRKSVREITADAVRLEGSLPIRDDSTTDVETERSESSDRTPETEPAGGLSGTDETEIADDVVDDDLSAPDETDTVEDRARGAEVDPTELAGRGSGLSVQPDDDDRRTDAAVDIGDDADDRGDE